jgi:hypothetical protein
MKIYDASGFDSKLTGSFTGSFYGDGSNLTGIVTYTQSEISGSSNLAISNILDGTTPVLSASRATTASFALNAGSSGFPFSGSADITGSLFVSGGNISGSFIGDGSGLTGVTMLESTIISASFTNANEYTASHNLNTEQVLINTYFNDGTQFFPQEIKVLNNSAVALKFNTSTSGRVVIAKAGHLVTGATLISENTISDTFTNASVISTSHNFNTKDVFVTVYLDDDTQIIPSEIKTTNENTVLVTLDQNRSGRIVVGKAGHIISGSTTITETSTITDTFSNTATKTVNHGFNTKDILVNVYTSDDEMIIPSSVNTISSGSVRITFDTPRSGRVVVAKGGHLVSGSSVASSVEYSNILNKPTLISSSTPPFPHTGSAIISGSLRVIGSVTADTYIVSSSITYTTQSFNSGSTIFGNSLDDTHLFTGSLRVTGSININNNITTIDPTEVDQTETLTSQTVTHQTQDAWYVFSADNVNYLTGGTSIADNTFLTGDDSGHLAHISFGPRSSSTGILPQSIVDFLNELPGVSGISTSYSLGTVPGKLSDFQGPVTFRVERDSSNFFEVEVHNVFIGWHQSDTYVNVAFSGNSATTVTHVAGNRDFHDSGSNDIQVPVFQTSNFIDGAGTWQSNGGYTISFTKQVPVPFKASINGDITATGTAYVTSSKVYNNNTSSGSLSFWQGSQTEYDAISSSADPHTFYIIRS